MTALVQLTVRTGVLDGSGTVTPKSPGSVGSWYNHQPRASILTAVVSARPQPCRLPVCPVYLPHPEAEVSLQCPLCLWPWLSPGPCRGAAGGHTPLDGRGRQGLVHRHRAPSSTSSECSVLAAPLTRGWAGRGQGQAGTGSSTGLFLREQMCPTQAPAVWERGHPERQPVPATLGTLH